MFSDHDFENEECIVIDHRLDICTVCCKNYKHHNRYLSFINGDRSIKDLEIITAHPCCRSLVTKIKEQQQKLVDLEWKLFLLRTK